MRATDNQGSFLNRISIRRNQVVSMDGNHEQELEDLELFQMLTLEEDKDNAFLNELEALSRLNHKNLVRLLGFCEDSNERVLVYEFMQNGTLHALSLSFKTTAERIPNVLELLELLQVRLTFASGIL
jgi:serine/threonine protein kinase